MTSEAWVWVQSRATPAQSQGFVARTEATSVFSFMEIMFLKGILIVLKDSVWNEHIGFSLKGT